MSNDPKVLVIGLDGGTLELIRSLVDKGIMPRMGDLLSNGVSGELESVFPAITAPAWTSFMTGKNPGKHGVFNFFRNLRDLDNRKIISHDSIKTETLISIANGSGKRIVSVNMPVTYPPPRVNGYVISGMFTPDLSSGFTYPANLYDELKTKWGEYVITVPFQKYDERHTDKFLEDIFHCMRQRTKYGLDLIRRRDWDLFMFVFTCTDYVQHAMWDYFPNQSESSTDPARTALSNRLLDFYRELDASLGQFFDSVDEETQVFIVSDHGFGPLKSRFYVNTWLEKLGLLHYSDDLGSTLRRSLTPLAASARRAVLKLDRFGLREKLRRPHKKNPYDRVFEMIDWSKTKAFCGSFSEQGIYINVEGSWPGGIVSPGEEYDEIRETVFSELKNLRDPDTGTGIAVECFMREDIYSGSHVNEAPDIVFAVDGGACIGLNTPSRKLFDKPDRSHGTGFHRMDGVLVASGRGIKKNAAIGGAKIIDVAPTILYSMGLAIPQDTDGSVLHELFEAEFEASRSERYSEPVAASGPAEEATYSEDDEKLIEDRLRGLGYL